MRKGKRLLLLFGINIILLCVLFLIPVYLWLTSGMMNIGVISIRGDSMTPTMANNDIVYIKDVEFERGEIVVASCPHTDDFEAYNNLSLLKRIVGLPGEIITITEEGVHVNGKLLDESAYTDDQTSTLTEETIYDEIYLSDREYYLLGDNRTESFDSRHVGEVPESNFLYALTTEPNDYTKSILSKAVVCAALALTTDITINMIINRKLKKRRKNTGDAYEN